jgi:hypothetical protein
MPTSTANPNQEEQNMGRYERALEKWEAALTLAAQARAKVLAELGDLRAQRAKLTHEYKAAVLAGGSDADRLQAEMDALAPRIRTLEEREVLLGGQAGRVPEAVAQELAHAAVEKALALQKEVNAARVAAQKARETYLAALESLVAKGEEAFTTARQARQAQRGLAEEIIVPQLSSWGMEEFTVGTPIQPLP